VTDRQHLTVMETPSLVALPISGDIDDSVIKHIIDHLPHSEEKELVLEITRCPSYTEPSENGLTPRNEYRARTAWIIDFKLTNVGTYTQNMGKLLGIHAVDESVHPPGLGLGREFCLWRQWFLANARLALQPVLTGNNLSGRFDIKLRYNTQDELRGNLIGHNWDETVPLREFVAQLVQRMNASSLRAGQHPGFSVVTYPAGEVGWHAYHEGPVARTEYHRVFYIPTSRSRQAVRATSLRGYELASPLGALPISGNIRSEDIPDSVVADIIDHLPKPDSKLILKIYHKNKYTDVVE
jgi:hypothetical protein